MAKREFLMLAHMFKGQDIRGWLMSEKLDGMRAFWDGGISCGKLCSEVPWANTQKDHIKRVPPVATGLWSRGGKVINAPGWFTSYLPNHPCDGELYAGPQRFQYVMTVVKGDNPDNRWHSIEYCCFGRPAYDVIFADGVIDKTHVELKGIRIDDMSQQFLTNVIDHDEDNDYFSWLIQEPLPESQEEALHRIDQRLDEVMRKNGEGLVLADPHALWEPRRSHNLLKVKKFQDDEGIVKGYIWGKKTDKGSRLLGLMGAVIVEYNGKTFELSGFTDEERAMFWKHTDRRTHTEGMMYPGKVVSDDIVNPLFKRGTKIRFKFRELTDDGIPKEGRFFR